MTDPRDTDDGGISPREVLRALVEHEHAEMMMMLQAWAAEDDARHAKEAQSLANITQELTWIEDATDIDRLFAREGLERLTQESEHRAARRQQFLDAMNVQFEKLSADVEAWKAESAERKEWDATTGDGQEPDGR